jgi:dTDP-4-amino-4,6-dideoxygalactose transaminase
MKRQNIRSQLPIPFNRAAVTGNELRYVRQAIESHKIGPGGRFVRDCQSWLTDIFQVPLALLTGSCTAALEIAAILLELGPGDEVIMPSFTYPSTANAIIRTGATAVFIDLDPDTMNLSPTAVSDAITEKTKAIVVVHYAGIACDMDRILKLAQVDGIAVIEDAAHALLAKHGEQWCGTLGTFGCFSFHESKNVHCGQGGALLINDPKYSTRAEIILEKGTDRRQFLRNEVDKYSWQDIGSSFALDEIRAAYLLAQLEGGKQLTKERVDIWRSYQQELEPLIHANKIQTAVCAEYSDPNGHIYWIKVADEEDRNRLVDHLANRGVHAIFHFSPLHTSVAGKRFGRFHGMDYHTSNDASRLLRLPIFQGFSEVEYVADCIHAFYA